MEIAENSAERVSCYLLRNIRQYYVTALQWIVLAILFMASGATNAQDPVLDAAMPPSSTETETDEQAAEESWLDKTEDYLADSVHDFSRYLDHKLAKKEDETPLVDRSYMRLRLKSGYTHRGYFDSDESVALRIDMPHLKNNWDLILETDPDDYDSLESKQRDLSGKSVKHAIDGAIGGVRLQNERLQNWRGDLDLGIKIKLPIDPFVRANIRRVEDLSSDWTVRFKQELFYYHSVGSGTLTELNFYHADKGDLSQIVKMSSSAQYLYEDDNWELLFQLQYFDRINDNHLMEYSSGISLEPNRADDISNYWISAAWKQKVYQNWLYLYITPQINAPREFDYKLNPGILMELEVFFSKNRKWDRLNRYIPGSTRVMDPGNN